MAKQTDTALVQLAARGSEHAFRTIYRSYVKPVYWIAHAMVGNPSDAEDVVQETFLVAWRKIGHLDLLGDSLLPWLATICRLQASNRIRRLRREREHTQAAATENLPAADSVEQQVLDADLASRIAEKVAGLSTIDRDIFQLCVAEGYAYQAAADHLEVSHGVVRNRLSRVRSKLRASLEESA